MSRAARPFAPLFAPHDRLRSPQCPLYAVRIVHIGSAQDAAGVHNGRSDRAARGALRAGDRR